MHKDKLASNILTGQWEVVLEEPSALIDSQTPSSLFASASANANNLPEPALDHLHSPTWLVHCRFFVLFTHLETRTLLLETFLSLSYLNTTQTSCPWALRYLAAAAGFAAAIPLSSFARHAINEVVEVIQLEEYQYHDRATSFFEELSFEFEFGAARE